MASLERDVADLKDRVRALEQAQDEPKQKTAAEKAQREKAVRKPAEPVEKAVEE